MSALFCHDNDMITNDDEDDALTPEVLAALR